MALFIALGGTSYAAHSLPRLELQATSLSTQTVTFAAQLTDNGSPMPGSQSWVQETAGSTGNPVETLPVQTIVDLEAGDVIRLEAAATRSNSTDAITAANPSGLAGTPTSVQLTFDRIG